MFEKFGLTEFLFLTGTVTILGGCLIIVYQNRPQIDTTYYNMTTTEEETDNNNSSEIIDKMNDQTQENPSELSSSFIQED